MNRWTVLAAAAAFGTVVADAHAVFVLGVDRTADRVSLYSGVDGSLVNNAFITDAASAATYDFNTPIEAIQVGQEIWISDQISDAIFRFSLGGTYLSKITGLDDIRGISLVGNQVHAIVNGTTSNTSFPSVTRSLIRFDASGGFVNSFPLQGSSWDVVPFGNDLLISESDADGIYRYSAAGAVVATFTDTASTGINFPQQMHVRYNGNILAAGFSGALNAGIYEFLADGTRQTTYAGGFGGRGILELLNGNYLFTKGDGVFVIDPAANTFGPAVLAGNMGFLNPLTAIPEPASLSLLALGSLALLRRAR